MSFIDINHLWQEYGNHVVLENLNLSINEGEFCTLVGASGCGKSTFLRLLLGQEKPSRGSILLEGQPLTAEPDASRGVVFQRYSVFPHLNVLDNVAIGLELPQAAFLGRLFGRRKKAAREQAAEMLVRVGLGHAWRSIRPSSPAACNSGWRSPRPLLCARAFCCWMNRSARSIPAFARICTLCCSRCGRKLS